MDPAEYEDEIEKHHRTRHNNEGKLSLDVDDDFLSDSEGDDEPVMGLGDSDESEDNSDDQGESDDEEIDGESDLDSEEEIEKGTRYGKCAC